ncbi:MAG TPA: DUF2946 family protein [Sphingomicrobium sp.]|jgi:hypothetical protein
MAPIRAAPIPIRFAWAMLFALLLAVRSLAPAGFMPAFEHGAVTIVACPDASPTAMAMHHHHPADHKSAHQPCPFAAASALGAVGPDWAPLPAVAFFGAALVLGRTFPFVQLHSRRERPPLRGPPIPA